MGVEHGPDGDALRLVVEQARSSLAGCDAAAVTAVVGERPVMVVGTNLLGCQLEEAQWGAGRGPGIDAMRQLQVFNVASLAAALSWPEFTRAALGRGMRSALSVPVTTRGRALGVLNLYSSQPGAFTGREPIALRHASAAALLLAGVGEACGAPPPCPPPGPGAAGCSDVMPAVP